MDLLSLEFIQRALIAAVLAGVTSPSIGSYIVQRRLSLLGDGLGHVAIAGVGLALATGTAPLPVAVLVAILGGIVIELLRESGKASADVAMAILFYGGLATGVLLAGLAGQGTGNLGNYLFGSLLTVSAADLWLILGLAVLVLVASIALMPQLFAVFSLLQFFYVIRFHACFPCWASMSSATASAILMPSTPADKIPPA